jgi:Chaperone of endosialidase
LRCYFWRIFSKSICLNQGNGTLSELDFQGNVLSHTFGTGLVLPTSCSYASSLGPIVYDYFNSQMVYFDNGVKKVVKNNVPGQKLNMRGGSTLYYIPLNSVGVSKPIGFFEDLNVATKTDFKEAISSQSDIFQFTSSDNLVGLGRYVNQEYFLRIWKSKSSSLLTVASDGTVSDQDYGFGRPGYSAFFTSNVFMAGSMGIGVLKPLAPLHVAGSSTIVGSISGRMFNYGSNALFTYTGDEYPSILAEASIFSKTTIGAFQNIAASDSRIKNITSLSNNSEDLERLRKIQITNYRMKDVATWGDKTFKKVISQQVEEVYPEVINKTKSVIPDIYALAESVAYDATTKNLSVTLTKEYNIKVGEKLELVHPEKGKILAEVVVVNGKTFTVKDWNYATDKIFVFGREVNDFRSVDYEALSMLGISAIQQLAKEVEELRITNDELRIKNEKLESKNNKTEARLEAIENLLKSNVPSGK